MTQKQAILIGAGPAGLTAAYELLDKTNIKPIIFEATKDIGGISKTVNYKGNRIDIGGHRFFSKSEKIMQWWLNILPLQETKQTNEYKLKNETRSPQNVTLNPEETDKIMLQRKRISRIFYLRKFFDYPLTLNINLFSNLSQNIHKTHK